MLVVSWTVTYKLPLRSDSTFLCWLFFFPLALISISGYLQLEQIYKENTRAEQDTRRQRKICFNHKPRAVLSS